MLARIVRLKVRLIFAWYDVWVGFYIDRDKRRLYVFPVPCLGMVFSWPDQDGEYCSN